jgi:glycylpeptide N-tetradecanoyltransferase
MQSFNNKHTMQMYGQKHLEELMKKDRSFWTSQPVPSPESLVNGELKDVSGPIEKKTIDEVSKEPGKLPEGYQWDIVDMDNAEQVEELYQHLYDHYVEDDDGYFRFNYGKDFIRWALTPPGYEKDMLISIRDSNTKKMVAFIAGVIINLRIEGKLIRATEVNFLCVLKDMRKLKFAPRLIQEVTRRSNVKGVWQGVINSTNLVLHLWHNASYSNRPSQILPQKS